MIAFFKKFRIVLAVFILALMAGVYASLIEPFTLRTAAWTVATPKWPYPQSLKIVLLSDAHIIWPWMTPAHLQTIVDAANKQQPDLVLLLGDYVGDHIYGRQIDPAAGLAPLKSLSARCGVYAVIGNHDLHGAQRWPRALVKTGIPLLRNRAVPVNCRGTKLWVAGLHWVDYADIGKALKSVGRKEPVIMAMHSPDSFPHIPKSVMLSVAGHTHGGQIRIPFFGPVASVVPSVYGNRYVYGHIKEGAKDLVVSSGLGMSGLPLRFLTPPEITVVTVTRSKSQPGN